MGVPQVVNLLRIANNYLPSVQDRYEQLLEHNNQLESILSTKSKELQNLNNHITDIEKSLDIINSEYELKTSMLQVLQQQAAKMEAFVNNYKNNDQEYIKLKKSIEDKVHESLSDKKRFLELAVFSVIESRRTSPDKYSSLVYHNNENSSKDNSSHSTRQILPPPPYDSYIIEHYKSTLLEESEKLYNDLVNQLVCEVINENVTEQTVPTTLSLPVLPSEGDDNKLEHNERNKVLPETNICNRGQ
jgi:chromosome segregation ATPase